MLKTDFLVLTFEDIWLLTNELAKKIRRENFNPDVLVGIARGGLVVTRILSDIMDNFKVAIMGVGFYKGINETEKEPIITQELPIDLADQKVLLIDDVSDSGKSFEFAVKYLQSKKIHTLKTVALHYKPHSIFKPDIFISKTSKWIVYPWEYMEFTRLYFKQKLKENFDKEEIAQNLLNINIPEIVVKEVLENMS
ncbi:MAG: phosphoribosyltransferase [Asgard group archaeon]|nr:phosphoribosyltransferase [Asgard group archaeon]